MPLKVELQSKSWKGGCIRSAHGNTKVPIGITKVPVKFTYDNWSTEFELNAKVLEYLPYEIVIGRETLREVGIIWNPVTDKIYLNSMVEIKEKEQKNAPIPEEMTDNILVMKETNNQTKGVILNKIGTLIPPQSSVTLEVKV